MRTDRIDGRQGFAASILKGVEEHAALRAFLDTALDGGVLREFRGDKLSDDLREGSGLFIGVLALQGQENVEARGAGGFQEIVHLGGLKDAVDGSSDAQDGGEGRTGSRI